jgi:hypothetical protein
MQLGTYRCGNCKRELSANLSIKRGIGPDCYKKLQREEARELAKLDAGDPEKERDILSYLIRNGIDVIMHYSADYAEKDEKLYSKKKYRVWKDYAYHSYEYLKDKVQNMKKHYDLIALAFDASYGDHTELVITLLMRDKSPNPIKSRKQKTLEVYKWH